MKFFVLGLLSIAFLSMTGHAGKYPGNDFISPVNREIKLSGTFGELRSNHFHAGLDIKSSNGASGDPVYAAKEGYISRIRVEEFGYGNALYIEHPNGFTTLYAHLDRFAPEIAAYVKREQYKAETFELDLMPEPGLFPVEQAQLIGNMGNTGYSLGPHLHFEIRHTEGQVPINPLHFGYTVPDQKPPVVQQLIAYELDEKGQVLHSKVLQPKTISSGKFGFTEPVKVGSPRVSFAVRTYDTQDGASNQNGVYSIHCKVDEDPTFAFAFDEIPFDQSRYLNAHIDYRRRIYENKFYHRCHPLEGNKLPIYYTGVDKGMIYLNAEQSRKVRLDVADFNGNISSLSFEVIRDMTLLPKAATAQVYQALGMPDEVCILSQPGIQVVWPKGSFYERTPLSIEVIPSEGLSCYSPGYAISPTDVPVHYFFDVNIEGLGVPEPLRDKAFVARCEPSGGIINCGATWIGNNLCTNVRQIGTYTIMVDTIAPYVSTLHFGPKMAGWTRMAFKISDNFSTKDKARDLLYDAWVDGQWILMTLDGKSGVLTHTFDGSIPAGDHSLLLKVTDDRGNVTVLEKTFTL
jgi:murein DD-endopeptidase MepM/ murein hydrolase activator NlpD